jgi:hypothetical protein
MACKHERALTKRYLGSEETYQFCPDCWETFGGEEGPAKQRMLADAAQAEELLGLEVEDG